MNHRFLFYCLLLSLFGLFACGESHKHIGTKEVVAKPEEINTRAEELIDGTLKDLLANKYRNDSLQFRNVPLLQKFYEARNYQPLWSEKGSFYPHSDSLLSLLDSAALYALFPEDYGYSRLMDAKVRLQADTSREGRLDASRWAYADLLHTAAFLQLTKDLYRGRLQPDSVLDRDSALQPAFFLAQFARLKDSGIQNYTTALEPAVPDYRKLRAALGVFLRKADLQHYSYLRDRDSAQYPTLVYRRLREEDTLLPVLKQVPDSARLAGAIRAWQKKKKLKTDGKLTPDLVAQLNNSDREKLLRIAITLDKLKSFPPLKDTAYIWVNIPSYRLQVRDSDSVVLFSKVVVGKPVTRTPQLTSSISYIITYPKWSIPESIISKEILPALKNDPGYLARKGYTLQDSEGKEVDPYGVRWAKYKKMIPYKVVQGSGDENALGVMKFTFPNNYSVYLHDTNQRYLFGKSKRALSHGCVRVQNWLELAYYLLDVPPPAKDSLPYGADSSRLAARDSLQSWLARKEKHALAVRRRIPLVIRYLTCEPGKNGISFYEDIYGEDQRLREKYFANK